MIEEGQQSIFRTRAFSHANAPIRASDGGTTPSGGLDSNRKAQEELRQGSARTVVEAVRLYGLRNADEETRSRPIRLHWVRAEPVPGWPSRCIGITDARSRRRVN